MANQHPRMTNESRELFLVTEKILSAAHGLLEDFNRKNFKLTQLRAHKRIFLFFLTRALKTFKSIHSLCQAGFSQDISTLLRSFLENLISVEYILCDPKSADQKAVRFVEYKWVVFKRYLPHDDKEAESLFNDPLVHELLANKKLIFEKLEEFKKKYNIVSDKALVTWSGRTVRDMAKMVSPQLREEYDSTFRLASRFSHPSIIGDKEYINYTQEHMIFSPFPSRSGISFNLQIASRYLLIFLRVFNEQFELGQEAQLTSLKKEYDDICFKIINDQDHTPRKPSPTLDKNKSRDPIIQFQDPAEDLTF